MNKILLPILLALTLSACGTTPDTKATVEDRTGATATTATPGPARGAESTGLDGAGVAGSALPGDQYAGDPRKDPASPLSKRSIFFDFDSYVVKPEYRPVLEAHAGYLLTAVWPGSPAIGNRPGSIRSCSPKVSWTRNAFAVPPTK